MTHPSSSTTPDTAQISAYLRRYARFEGEAPPPPAAPATPTDTPPANGGTGEAKTFTQADLDKYASEARKSARSAAVSDLLKELGVEKPDDLKALVTKTREQEEAQKTEAQRALERAEKAEQRAKDAEERATQIEAQRVLDRRDSAIRAKSSQAHDIAAVLEWANRPANAELLKKTVGDDGTVSEKAVDELIAAAQKNAAYLWKKGGVGSPSNSNGRVPTGKKPAVIKTSGNL